MVNILHMCFRCTCVPSPLNNPTSAYSSLLWLHFTPLASTASCHGSTWVHLPLHYCGMASSDSTCLHSTMALFIHGLLQESALCFGVAIMCCVEVCVFVYIDDWSWLGYQWWCLYGMPHPHVILHEITCSLTGELSYSLILYPWMKRAMVEWRQVEPMYPWNTKLNVSLAGS